MQPKRQVFHIFRYQLVPSSTQIQMNIFGNRFSTYDELVKIKNLLFYESVVDEKTRYRGQGYNVISKIEYSSENDIVLRLGVEKQVIVSKPDFNKGSILNYPNIYVYINNRPDQQFIAIENNYDAFTSPNTVAKFINNSLSAILSRYNLSLYIEQTFYESEFWETIKQYEGQITSLKFRFIKPNLANISGSIKTVFQELENNHNSHKTDLAFHAPKKGVLENIEKGQPDIEALVSYNKEGGGPPPIIKVKKIRRSIKTTKSERTITINDFEGPADALAEI